MIVCQSTFHLLPDSRDTAIKLMSNMVRLCRQEHGCLAYEYYEGVTNPFCVVLLQEWEDADCLKAHYQTDHMEKFLSRLGNCLERPVTTRSYISQEESRITAKAAEESPTSEQIIH